MATARTRTCVACGRASTKADLIRFVRTEQGLVACDPTGRRPGRGAYVCPERSCFDVARRRHSLERALRTKIDDETYGRLDQEFDPLCCVHSAQ